jgi:deoxyribodipyrimidine photo-lyase
LLWFRLDLRLADNPALAEAMTRATTVVPVFIWSPAEEAPWPPGAASRWWLHHSLSSLDAALRRRGSRLVVASGPPLHVLRQLVRQTGARHVVWARRYEPALREHDAELKRRLAGDGIDAVEVPGNLLSEPWETANASDKPFQVFSAYWRSVRTAANPPSGGPPPRRIRGPRRWPRSLEIADLKLLPRPDWAGGLRAAWRPGERGARLELRRFQREALGDYATGRDRLGYAGTSRLSPHLHFGEICVRRIWQDTLAKTGGPAGASKDVEAFLRELVWREFAHHLLYHFPHTTTEPLRPAFARFPWSKDRSRLRAWQRGRTGFPVVDAGLRQLWQSGWMHNRARMIVASFLVKQLLVPWQEGAAWFWDTLVDSDLANNTLGWQWSAGCGADAAPYFRVFNPVLQGKKFDADAAFVRRWVPELARLPDRWIHRPWMAPPAILEAAGVELGASYPEPLVDLASARTRALKAFTAVRAERSGRKDAPRRPRNAQGIRQPQP